MPSFAYLLQLQPTTNSHFISQFPFVAFLTACRQETQIRPSWVFVFIAFKGSQTDGAGLGGRARAHQIRDQEKSVHARSEKTVTESPPWKGTSDPGQGTSNSVAFKIGLDFLLCLHSSSYHWWNSDNGTKMAPLNQDRNSTSEKILF